MPFYQYVLVSHCPTPLLNSLSSSPEVLEQVSCTMASLSPFTWWPYQQTRAYHACAPPTHLLLPTVYPPSTHLLPTFYPPIGSATLQLAGRKRWTLVPAGQSYRLRPSLSPDGRAFFCTRRAHGAGGVAALTAAGAAHYEVEPQ